jgi:hypothetical protein
MAFEEIPDRVLEMLQRRGRVSYRALKRQFDLDDAYLEALKEDILCSHPQVVDEDGRGLVWTGEPTPSVASRTAEPPSPIPAQITTRRTDPRTADAERRQLTVMFCDLVDSTVSLASAQHYAAFLHQRSREALAVQAQADALLTLATAQGFPVWVGIGTFWRGWALAMQGQGEAGLVQMRQGMAALVSTGLTLSQSLCLVRFTEGFDTADLQEAKALLEGLGG